MKYFIGFIVWATIGFFSIIHIERQHRDVGVFDLPIIVFCGSMLGPIPIIGEFVKNNLKNPVVITKKVTN